LIRIEGMLGDCPMIFQFDEIMDIGNEKTFAINKTHITNVSKLESMQKCPVVFLQKAYNKKKLLGTIPLSTPNRIIHGFMCK